MLTDQALIHAWASSRSVQHEAMPSCPQRVVQSIHRVIRPGPLELGHSRLTDSQPVGELRLGETGLAARFFEQQGCL